MTDRIYLFDTTLRDGAQTQGVDFSVADKVAIAQALDRLGIDYIEGGTVDRKAGCLWHDPASRSVGRK